MTHNPYAVTARKPLTPKQRLKLLLDNKGKCCICGLQIAGYREQWDDYDLSTVPFVDEHIRPLSMDGTNDWDNRAPAHVRCARAKSSKEATDRAKVRKIAERHFGAKRSKPKSKFRRKFNGEVVPRDQE